MLIKTTIALAWALALGVTSAALAARAAAKAVRAPERSGMARPPVPASIRLTIGA